MAAKRDPEIAAVETVHAALKPLDPEARQRVISSVYALLDIPGAPNAPVSQGREIEAPAGEPRRSSATRPMALVELMQDKSPGTNAQRITLFAYYREKYEGKARFARADLRPYFAKAREHPPQNFDRDFVEAVRKGWIHEEEEDSYITSKGVEAAEAGFPGERAYKRKTAARKGARKKKVQRKKKAKRKKAAKPRRKSPR
jgi:hypothetical protein